MFYCALLAAAAAVGIGKAPDEHVHLFSPCGINSHSYWADNTPWRCVMCGALAPRDGDLHGQAKDGAPSAPYASIFQ